MKKEVDLCDSDGGKNDILDIAEDDNGRGAVVNLCDSDDTGNDTGNDTDIKNTNSLVKKEEVVVVDLCDSNGGKNNILGIAEDDDGRGAVVESSVKKEEDVLVDLCGSNGGTNDIHGRGAVVDLCDSDDTGNDTGNDADIKDTNSLVKKEEDVVVDLCDSGGGKKEDDNGRGAVVDLCDSDNTDIKDTNSLVKKEDETTMTEAMIVTPSSSPASNNKRRRNGLLKPEEEDSVDNDATFMDYTVGSGDVQTQKGKKSKWCWNLAPDGSPSVWSPHRVKVKREQDKREAAKNEAMGKHGSKILLHRFNGIALLGGGTQNTFQRPGKSFLIDGKPPPGYPVPAQGIKQNEDGGIEYYLNGFTALCYNTTWQPNGPKFAGQPTAAVDDLPDYMKEEGLVFPVFMKRSLTKKKDTRENHVLGWEYVGNYRCISDEDVVFWESADNFTKASKNEIANKMYQSSQSISDTTYGTTRLAWWRDHLGNEIENEQNDENESNLNSNSIATRALALGYTANISDKDLCHLLVELDEFHRQETIEFVEYDELIYKFCSKGLTSKNSKGQTLAKHGGEHATASDYYNHAMQHNLM